MAVTTAAGPFVAKGVTIAETIIEMPSRGWLRISYNAQLRAPTLDDLACTVWVDDLDGTVGPDHLAADWAGQGTVAVCSYTTAIAVEPGSSTVEFRSNSMNADAAVENVVDGRVRTV